MQEQLAALPRNLTGHLQLTLMALMIGIVISLPLGIWVTRRPHRQGFVLGAAGVIQTIPTLALLAVMVPLLAALGQFTSGRFGFAIPGFGYVPAVIALTLYSLLPLLQNTVAGIRGVEPALIQAAKGVGMTPMQQLLRVELPLAMPVVVAGIRTATIWAVGMATIATPVGASSLGNYIFSGLQTRNTTAILFGCVAAALLAMLLDGLVHAVQSGIQQGRRIRLAVALVGVVLLYAYALGAWIVEAQSSDERTQVRIGAKPFTEQQILGELIAQSLVQHSNVEARIFRSLGSTVVFDALKHGEIDVYVDYAGTLWTTALRHRDSPSSEQLRQQLTEELRERHGIVVLGALGFDNSYAFAMRDADARRLGISTLSDVARIASTLVAGADYEFFGRQEWRSVRESYGFDFRDKRSMDPSLMYQAIAHRQLDVISAYTTDGRIRALNLRLLRDDRSAIPPYDALLLVNANFAKRHPNVVASLRGLVGRLQTSTMQQLNLAVDQEGKTPRDVAAAFLAAQP